MGYVLVVYDDPEELHKVRVFLHVSGYEVKAVDTWDKARTLFDGDQSCDLIITKVRMKEITDSDILHYIRNSKKPCIPVIGINTAANDVNQNLFDSVLTAPCTLEVLGESVSSFATRMPRE